MNILLIPLTPESLCPLINGCKARKFATCKRAALHACGFLPRRYDVEDIDQMLIRFSYWQLPLSLRIEFIKNVFAVNVDISEVDSRPYIARIISARLILRKR